MHSYKRLNKPIRSRTDNVMNNRKIHQTMFHQVLQRNLKIAQHKADLEHRCMLRQDLQFLPH